MAGDANRKSYQAVEQWHRAAQRVERLKRDVEAAESELMKAQNDLGKHLCPGDAAIGESFQMWIHTEELGFVEKERIVVVTRTGQDEYSAKWRESSKTAQIKAVA